VSLGAPPMSGSYTDPDGSVWDYEYSPELDVYRARNRTTTKLILINREDVFNAQVWSDEILRTYRRQLEYENIYKPKPTRRHTQYRWRSRMLRLREAAIEKRMKPVYKALWLFGWVWGIIIAASLTLLLVGFLSSQVLG